MESEERQKTRKLDGLTRQWRQRLTACLTFDVRRTDIMGLLGKLFRAVPSEEMSGIHLDVQHPRWEVSGETDFPSLFTVLPELLPDGCILYFEDGSPDGELLDFLRAHSVPKHAHVASGTIWPRPKVFRVPAESEPLQRLAELTRSCASPELAVHFHVYRDQKVLLEWHDVFDQEMLLSGEFPEQRVRTLADRLHMSYQRVEPETTPNGGPATPVDNPNVPGGSPSVS